MEEAAAAAAAFRGRRRAALDEIHESVLRRALGALLALACLTGAAVPASRLIVTVTEVSPTAAIVWARAAGAGPVTIEIATVAGNGRRSMTAVATAAEDFVVRVPLDGLTPARRHRYQVTQGAERVEGEFTTAPMPDDPARVTFLWSGDLGGGGLCRPVGG